MTKTMQAAGLAVLGAAALAGSAAAEPGACRQLMSLDDPPVPTGQTVCHEEAWFRQADSRLSNAGTAVPSWGTTKPAAGFQDGGAIYASPRLADILSSSQATRPTFSGTYTGTLDNIALSVYETSPVYQVLGGAPPLYSRLIVDGKVIWENSASTDPEIAPLAEGVDDTTSVMRFAYTGIAQRLAALGKANDSTTKHTIEISFVNKYYGDGNFLMRYDAAEYPSGLIFNLDPDPDSGSLSGYTEVATG